MIALKSVKTLPAMMLEVEREEVSGGGPSLRSRASASCAGEPGVRGRLAVPRPIQ